MEFNTSDSTFVGRFTVNTNIQKPTVVYANIDYWYHDGLDLVLTCGSETLLNGLDEENEDVHISFEHVNCLLLQVLPHRLNGTECTIQIKRTDEEKRQRIIKKMNDEL